MQHTDAQNQRTLGASAALGVALTLMVLATLTFSGCSLLGEEEAENNNTTEPSGMMEEGSKDDAMMEGEGAMMEEGSKDDAMMEGEGAMMEAATESFSVSGKNFAFMMNGQENPTITVKKGTKVTVNFSSESGFHDFVIDELGAATKQIQTGESSSVTFTADKEGSFAYYCSVGQHRANGMEGMFVVTE